jgi:hypothetical protein
MRACVLLLLVSPLAAQELRDFFDPSDRAFPLAIVEKAEFAKLDAAQRLIARGFERNGYFEPPKFKDAIPQALSPRGQLHPGFGYRERLASKQRLWLRAAHKASVRSLLRQMERLPLLPPAEFVGRYTLLAQGNPRQVLLALRHSERQFRSWWIDEVGRAVRAARKTVRKEALRTLNGYLPTTRKRAGSPSAVSSGSTSPSCRRRSSGRVRGRGASVSPRRSLRGSTTSSRNSAGARSLLCDSTASHGRSI